MLATTMLQVMSMPLVMNMAQIQSPITQCADNSLLPLYFFNGCTGLVCCKEIGDTIDFGIAFKTQGPATSLTLQLRAVNSMDIDTVADYPSPEPNACLKLQDGISCPVDADQTVNYTSTYPVTVQPAVYFVESRMVNENNELQTCFVQVVTVASPGTCE